MAQGLHGGQCRRQHLPGVGRGVVAVGSVLSHLKIFSKKFKGLGDPRRAMEDYLLCLVIFVLTSVLNNGIIYT